MTDRFVGEERVDRMKCKSDEVLSRVVFCLDRYGIYLLFQMGYFKVIQRLDFCA